MYIIAGLGNPGTEYSDTRHNTGFITVDMISREFDIKMNRIKFKAIIGEGTIGRMGTGQAPDIHEFGRVDRICFRIQDRPSPYCNL